MDPQKVIDKAQERYATRPSGVSTVKHAPADQFMLLPAKTLADMRLVKVPADYESHEAFRRVTGLIAEVEADGADYDWEDIQSMLEDQGFETVEFMIGPSLD